MSTNGISVHSLNNKPNDDDTKQSISDFNDDQNARVEIEAAKMRGILSDPPSGRQLMRIREPHSNKRTFYFKEHGAGKGAYFVKLNEVLTKDKKYISKSAKRLHKDMMKARKQRQEHPLSRYVLLPLDVQKKHHRAFTYELEVYEYMECENFEERVTREIKESLESGRPPYSELYQLSVLPLLVQSVVISIAMKDARWFDADISPDQFIYPRIDGVSTAKAGDLRKIDHESMVQYNKGTDSVLGQREKPMKRQFMAPEMRSEDGKYTEFEVEKASVYMVGAVIVYVLFGQFVQGQHGEEWTPELLPSSWQWLGQTLDPDPAERPSLEWTKQSLTKMLRDYMTMWSPNRVHDPRIMSMRYFEAAQPPKIECDPKASAIVNRIEMRSNHIVRGQQE